MKLDIDALSLVKLSIESIEDKKEVPAEVPLADAEKDADGNISDSNDEEDADESDDKDLDPVDKKINDLAKKIK